MRLNKSAFAKKIAQDISSKHPHVRAHTYDDVSNPENISTVLCIAKGRRAHSIPLNLYYIRYRNGENFEKIRMEIESRIRETKEERK